jgi:hypothetical protein
MLGLGRDFPVNPAGHHVTAVVAFELPEVSDGGREWLGYQKRSPATSLAHDAR